HCQVIEPLVEMNHGGIVAGSSASWIVCMNGGVGLCGDVDGCVWGDKDGEDVILEGDDSGA
ncbi:hypothetical protein Tco_1458425, partial [Tanacetum coccineum]